MADLASSDLTYTLLSEDMTEGSKVRRRFAITTAAGEYPTGGLPLDNDKMGYPHILFLERDAADGLLDYRWDKSANKIIVFEDDGTSGIPAEHANATFTSPDQLVVEVVGW